MLIISRKKDQKIIVADEIEITLLEVGRNRVRFGIKAPKHIPIHTRLKSAPATSEQSEELEVELEASGDAFEAIAEAVGALKHR